MSLRDYTCYNCHKDLADCKCGNKRETWDDSEGPVCPHCGHLNKACDSDGLLYNEATTDWYCGECEKQFRVNIYISHSWTSTLSEDADE